MTPVEYLNPGTPPVDDPQVAEAMRVYDGILNDTERREVFRSMYRAVLAYDRTQDVDHLARLSLSVKDMVLLEQQPGFTEARRAPRKPPTDPCAGAGIAEVVRRLREDVTS